MTEIKKKPATTNKESVPDASFDDQVRRRAYELYEQRGKEEGHDLEDWLRAEAEIDQKRRSVAA